MGVPQKRERTFFIARQIGKTAVKFDFNEPSITIKNAIKDIKGFGKDQRNSINYKYYKMCKPGEPFSKYHPKSSLFQLKRLDFDSPAPTITSSFQSLNYHPDDAFNLTDAQIVRLQSFPDDYDFLKSDPGYVCGMSVPPLMMQRVASEVARQLF